MSERLDKLEAELKDLRKELESSSKEMRKALAKSSDEAKEAFADIYDNAQDSGENLLDDAKYYTRRSVDKVCQVTEDNPWLVTGALAGIAIAGIVTAVFLRRDDYEWRRYLPEDAINDLLRKIR